MIAKIFSSKKITLLLTILLLTILMFTYGLSRSSLLAEDKAIASSGLSSAILYFVPEDEGKMEDRLTPDSLARSTALESSSLTFSATSSWENAKDRISSQGVKVIIIHHAALNLVNRAELQDLFGNENVVVTGIGIPGLELAEFLGYPTLFTSTWPPDEGYTTTYYFYTYSLTVSGGEEELERLREIGWVPGQELPSGEVVPDSFGVRFGSSTDSLLAAGSIDQLFQVIQTYLIPAESTTIPSE